MAQISGTITQAGQSLNGTVRASGRGIASVDINNDGYLVVTYTDGEIWTSDEVIIGNGIESIELTSTSGAVKTYTITFTDGTTTTFNVTDGEVTNASLALITGNLTDLDTTNKTNIVSAVNEVNSDKADTDGVYPDLSAGNITGDFHIDTKPYLYRALRDVASHIGSKAFDTLVGGTVAVNQLAKDFNSTNCGKTYTNDNVSFSDGVATFTASQQYGGFGYAGAGRFSIVSGHKYFVSFTAKCVTNGAAFGYNYALSGANFSYAVTLTTSFATYQKIINAGATGVGPLLFQDRRTSGWDEIQVKDVNVIDLTQMFGSTIADYVYTLEQGTAGSGIAWLKSYGYIRDSYIPYNAGTLQSVKTTAHVTRNADDTIINNYPLDDIELRGVAKLVNNEIVYDGDIYESDGTVTRKYASVDLGTLDYGYQAGEGGQIGRFNTTGIASDVSRDGTVMTALVCPKFIADVNPLYARDKDNAIAVLSSNGTLYISCSAYNTAAAFKTAMSGVYLVYKKATPTTETADPFTSPQQVFADGTEEYIDNRAVPIPVGHETKYELDLASKLIGLPWDLSMLAPIENGTTASQAYAAGKYFVRNNEFCKAKTSIASGATFTLGTNYEVTTVGAELFALA